MSYDVKSCCLEYLRYHQQRAERMAADAATCRAELNKSLEAASARERKVLDEMKRLAPRVEKFRNVRKVSDKVKGLRARWRELRHEASVMRRDVRRQEREVREAARDVALYDGISHKIGGVYAYVEQTWIPGCFVEHEPVFKNLIPEF